ncbi:zinc-dependent alcohol dehydrogenase family protein [Isoptericola sp. S6320L]|uniref:zinc-dependent alcohol dehydrogenase family protein n=1 Tax=Isoptericola sp. S6320L TaxID=2926411 RepID=UPI001FF34EAE|nr:zinc-dependent alcohol dehydrogenase family protein [Isoptericola sp. S6320L]MCK0118640.1 zinc-dependent alcohol dehydrogenase family protein [Isoptericola sp. S6320L]
MKALVFEGPGRRTWREVPDPVVEAPQDAVVRIDTVTICGTDLHILKGDVPTVDPGRVLGHEAVGTVTEVGSGLSTLKVGDRVLVSCITSCGRCQYCRTGRYGQCLGGGGWILGHRIDGTQAQLCRVPFAETSTHLLDDAVSDEQALMLADILPTAYEVGVLAGNVRPGNSVVVVGAGPIGLAAVLTARLFSPAVLAVVDLSTDRQAAALRAGATHALDPGRSLLEQVRELTGGLGADVAIEAVGTPGTFETCVEIVRPGGHVANVGVHGAPATLHLERDWIRDLTITTGLVDTATTPALLNMVASGQLDVATLVTHRFDLGAIEEAYEVFSDAGRTGAMKVALSAGA